MVLRWGQPAWWAGVCISEPEPGGLRRLRLEVGTEDRGVCGMWHVVSHAGPGAGGGTRIKGKVAMSAEHGAWAGGRDVLSLSFSTLKSLAWGPHGAQWDRQHLGSAGPAQWIKDPALPQLWLKAEPVAQV